MTEEMKLQWFAINNARQDKYLWYCYCISFFIVLFLVQGCAETQEIRVPARELYYQGFMSYEDGFFSDAEEKWKKIIEEHPGTRLATLAYLKMGDIDYERSQWDDADSNYRMFLILNPKSHLTPYVFNRLIALNYERNVRGLFFKEREYDRDMEPNRKIIQDHQRFFLLYPSSGYLTDVHSNMLKARSDLAKHEFLVANFYFDHEAFDSAILRYMYLLKYFPEYPNTEEVTERLIEAYRRNQQFDLADEMEQVLKFRRSIQTQHLNEG